jgi:hypothetical protein
VEQDPVVGGERPAPGESGASSEQDEVDAARREAAHIGGSADTALPPEQRPLVEAGEGEAEGFELAEDLLVEHASHGDEQSAHAVLHHQGLPEEEQAARADGEADHEMLDEDSAGEDEGTPAGHG